MQQRPGILRRILPIAGLVLAVVTILGFGLWAAGALWYQMPAGLLLRNVTVAIWAAVSLTAFFMLFSKHRRPTMGAYAVLAALLLVWWMTITPSNDRDWADDVGKLTTGTVSGDSVTIENVRNFDWRSPTDYTIDWQTRTYDLAGLASVDLLLSYWAGPSIAHTLVSFGFDDGSHVTFSVEIRKERHEAFSSIGGFFKEFETSVVAADERDIVRVRTNIRKEDVYLYRINMPKPAMRSLFLAYIDKANALAESPRFYHTLTANCTTIVYEMVSRIVAGLPLDHRLLLSGYLPEYIIDVGGFMPGLSLDQLRTGGRIADRALAADAAPDFSARIREGVPGITPLPGP